MKVPPCVSNYNLADVLSRLEKYVFQMLECQIYTSHADGLSELRDPVTIHLRGDVTLDFYEQTGFHDMPFSSLEWET